MVPSKDDFESLPPAVQRKVCSFLFLFCLKPFFPASFFVWFVSPPPVVLGLARHDSWGVAKVAAAQTKKNITSRVRVCVRFGPDLHLPSSTCSCSCSCTTPRLSASNQTHRTVHTYREKKKKKKKGKGFAASCMSYFCHWFRSELST